MKFRITINSFIEGSLLYLTELSKNIFLMKNVEFGAYLKELREEKGIPQRKVAHAIDVDTSTLSKMELGERPISIHMIKPWVDTLEADFKDVQIRFISEKVLTEFNEQPYLKDALELVIKRFND